MQCLLGCAGVSPAQHNYSLFWCVVLKLRCVPTMFFCLLLAFLCSSSLVFPSACFLLCSVLYATVLQISLFCFIFLNLLLKLSRNDLLKLFEQNISINYLLCFCLFVWVLNSTCCKLPYFVLLWHSRLSCYCTIRCTGAFHPHLNRSHQPDSCDWQAWLAWGCEMLVSMLFTLPAWQSSMSLQMFPESCKYLLCVLMSVDSLSDHTDMSLFLYVCILHVLKNCWLLTNLVRWSEGLNENIT